MDLKNKILILIFITFISLTMCIDLKKSCAEFKDCDSCSLCTTNPNHSAQNCKVHNLTNCAWCKTSGKCVEKTNATACPIPVTNSCSFFNTNLIIGTFSVVIGGAMCVAGGISGGGVFVPTFILLLGLSPHFAIPLSKVTIVGAAVGGCVISLFRRHPFEDRPIIYYEISMIMEPGMLLGTVLGVLLNVLFPAYLLTFLLIIILIAFVIRMFRKAMAAHREEQKKKLTEVENQEKAIDYIKLEEKDEINVDDPKKKEMLNEILKSDARNVPWEMVISFILVFVGFFVLILFRSTNKNLNVFGIKCGSWEYWIIFVSVIPYVAICNFLIGLYLYKSYCKRISCGFEFKNGDVEWSIKNIIFFSVVSVLAGTISGFLGVGGALVNGPFMLAYGIIPSVSVATTIFMTLFTSLSTTLQFILIGRLTLYSALWYCCAGMAAGLLGMYVVGYVVKKYNKQSLVIFAVSLAILASTIAMIVVQIANLVNYFKGTTNKKIAFNSACEH